MLPRNKILDREHNCAEKPIVTLRMPLLGCEPCPWRTKLDTQHLKFKSAKYSPAPLQYNCVNEGHFFSSFSKVESEKKKGSLW